MGSTAARPYAGSLCGVVGALLFTAVYLLEGPTRPGYDAWVQPISALSLGRGGWVQQANFALYGVLLVLSALGWYRVLTPGRGVTWFLVLQGIGGLALIGAGTFSMDLFPGCPPGVSLLPATTHGTLHSIFAWVRILALAQSCFAMAAILWRTSGGRGWSAYSYLTGALMLIFWGVFILTHHPRHPLEMEGGTTFHFVTDGIERALERARESAGGKDVRLWGGAQVIQQYLAAGLLDELELHIVPVLLGDGARLFDNLGDVEPQLEQVRVVEAPGVTHIEHTVA